MRCSTDEIVWTSSKTRPQLFKSRRLFVQRIITWTSQWPEEEDLLRFRFLIIAAPSQHRQPRCGKVQDVSYWTTHTMTLLQRPGFRFPDMSPECYIPSPHHQETRPGRTVYIAIRDLAPLRFLLWRYKESCLSAGGWDYDWNLRRSKSASFNYFLFRKRRKPFRLK